MSSSTHLRRLINLVESTMQPTSNIRNTELSSDDKYAKMVSDLHEALDKHGIPRD